MTNQTRTLIPLEVLFGNPTTIAPVISPDGSNLSFRAPVNGVMNVWVRLKGEADATPVTDDKDRGIRAHFWSKDSRTIFYIQDIGGNENWRLYATDIDTRETRDLTPFENVQVHIVHYDFHHPNEMIIGMNLENPKAHDLYLLVPKTGELRMIAKNPGYIMRWLVDSKLEPIGAEVVQQDGSKELLVRKSVNDEWSTLLTWDPDDAAGSHAMHFSSDGSSLYLIDSRAADTAQLVKLRLDDGHTEVIYSDPKYDVQGAMCHHETLEPLCANIRRAKQTRAILDDSVRDDFAFLEAFCQGEVGVVSRDHADSVWVIADFSDHGPTAYYLYNRVQKQMTFLFKSRPDLDDYELAPMEPISFVSRDGLTIHGYLTLPVGEQKTDLPLVLVVHGGPQARDAWGFDSQIQWLANRGYACLQVNFRGSRGYGKSFLNAGDREWGGKMQDDLTDAVQWAIEQGIAAPTRVAIYGGSYGGYAALAGATFTPDLFRCAIDVVGPSNIVTLLRAIPPQWTTMASHLYKSVGHPDKDEEFLKSRSPLFHVDQIKIPILVAQGANDPRVPQSEAEQIVEAMKRKGIEYEYLLFPDEGHGFAKPENRMNFYQVAEEFLAKYLGS